MKAWVVGIGEDGGERTSPCLRDCKKLDSMIGYERENLLQMDHVDTSQVHSGVVARNCPRFGLIVDFDGPHGSSLARWLCDENVAYLYRAGFYTARYRDWVLDSTSKDVGNCKTQRLIYSPGEG